MLLGKFNEALKEYDDDFLYNAYIELQILDKTGAFPVNQRYFGILCDERRRIYGDSRNIDATRKDLMDEIARRWYEQYLLFKEQNHQDVIR